MLEKVNYSKADTLKKAQLSVDLFDWEILWQGTAMETGYTVHAFINRKWKAIRPPDIILNILRE